MTAAASIVGWGCFLYGTAQSLIVPLAEGYLDFRIRRAGLNVVGVTALCVWNVAGPAEGAGQL